ncbi:MAG: phosphoribosyl-ATP diphosphatase [Alphaproteobacteria bacterium]|nr:phosphoribosyl-ATP diphosphatase [Alphaproteobacteria bacterium]
MPDILDRLYTTILNRRGGDPATSYTTTLFAKGPPAMARKVGEEAVETVVAAMQDDRNAVIRESADLLYHLMVLWADQGISPADVFAELERREGKSGLAEKAARKG